MTWLPPPSLPGCPILYYTITILELNITNITTSTSIYYLLSDIIISNEIYTVTISATNGASTGNEIMYYFNISLGNTNGTKCKTVFFGSNLTSGYLI